MTAESIIYLIDDDDPVRDSLEFLMSSNGFRAASYASAEEFLAALPTLSQGCIVTDIRMPGMSGLELVQKLGEVGITMPVIVITGHGDVPLAVEAMKAGVMDFLEKPFENDVLLSAVRAAFRRVAGAQETGEKKREIGARMDSLSPRERDVLNGLVAGQPNKVIAFDLGISPRTVEIYRANVMTKMQAASLSDLVRMALLVGQ
jgi:two-component system response regulator FixJ